MTPLSPSAPTKNAAYSANTRTIHFWAIGSMADCLLYTSFALIVPVFTTGFHMDPKLVGWALMLPRLTDALVDPVLGHFSDVVHTPWGRRRPFIFCAALLGALTEIALWWISPDWNQMAQFACLLVASIMLFICYGTFTMTHQALGYELSDDYHFRTKIVAIRGFYFAIANLFAGWAYWLTMRPCFGNEINGIRWVGGVVATIVVVAGLTPVFTCQERFQNANRRHVDLWKAMRQTFQNRAFVVVVLIRVVQTFGFSLYGTMAFYIGAYSVCGGDKSLYSATTSGIGGIAGLVGSMLLMPLAAGISRRLGKRRGIIWSLAGTLLASIVLPFFARPGYPYLLVAHMLIFMPANMLLAMFMSAVMPDICDIDELTSGERREGLFSAVLSFVGKMQNSVCVFIGMNLLAWTGFNGALIAQPQVVLDKIRWVGFAPAIFFNTVTLLISFLVPITEKYMAEVRAKLDERHAAAAATAEATEAVAGS